MKNAAGHRSRRRFFCWFTDGAPPEGVQVVWAEFGLLPVPRFKLLVYVYN